MWTVAAPALVEERLGPVAALGRSRYLTGGARWKILGLTLVIVVSYWIASAVVTVASIAWYDGPVAMEMAWQDFSAGFFLVNAIVQTIISAFWGVTITSLYVELRNWKDGPAAEALADVFG